MVEHFQHGIAGRLGLAEGLLALLVGGLLALESLAVALALAPAGPGGHRQRWGLAGMLAGSLLWVAGAAWDHGADLWRQGAGYRTGWPSTLWVGGLVLSRAATAALAAVALGRMLRSGRHGPRADPGPG